MSYKFKISGPFKLLDIDDSNSNYLYLKFDDGFTRKMSKGGKWPPEYAQSLLRKAVALKGHSVCIKTSQTTKPWDPNEWMCDLHAQEVVEKKVVLANQLNPLENNTEKEDEDGARHILISLGAGKTYYANSEAISNYFSSEDDFLDFSQSFENEFVASWVAKNARTKGLPFGVKRVRISGLGNRTKRNGFRVVAAEAKTDETNETFKFFHLLKIDEKTDNVDYPTDSEIKELLIIKESLESKYPKALVNWME
jgi:hypothetical protein